MHLWWPRCKLVSLSGTLSCRLEVADREQQVAARGLLQLIALASGRGTDLYRTPTAQPQLAISGVDNGSMPHQTAEAEQCRQLTVWNGWCREALQSVSATSTRQCNGDCRFPLTLLLTSADAHDSHRAVQSALRRLVAMLEGERSLLANPAVTGQVAPSTGVDKESAPTRTQADTCFQEKTI